MTEYSDDAATEGAKPTKKPSKSCSPTSDDDFDFELPEDGAPSEMFDRIRNNPRRKPMRPTLIEVFTNGDQERGCHFNLCMD